MGLDMYLWKAKTPRDMGGENPRTMDELRQYDDAHETAAQKARVFDELMKGDVFLKGNSFRYVSAFDDVGYWRKANHIHKWFVENVQNGEDDCGIYPVTFDQLAALRAVCQAVIDTAKVEAGTIVNGQTLSADGWKDNEESGQVVANPEEVAKLLPTESGFFFGGTNYDEYYMRDVSDTIEIVDKIPAADSWENKGLTYFYHSSW